MGGTQNKKRVPSPYARFGPGSGLPGHRGQRYSFYSYERTPALVHNKHKGLQWLPPKRKPPSLLNAPEIKLFPFRIEAFRYSVYLIYWRISLRRVYIILTKLCFFARKKQRSLKNIYSCDFIHKLI